MTTKQENSKPRLTVKDYFRIHVDIPTVVIVLFIITIAHRSLLNWIFKGIDFITKKCSFPEWTKDISINVISEFIAVAFLIFLGFLYFRFKSKPYYAGKFTAYEVTKTEEKGADDKITIKDVQEEWGVLRLTYNIFSNRIKGILKKKDGSSTLLLNGEFDKARYFRGTYVEEKPSSLRLGAFLMLLDPSGDDYTGSFVFLSPDTGIKDPTWGYAKWVKIK